eukprot:365203-Chlamydomonas_euryale.AAC.16
MAPRGSIHYAFRKCGSLLCWMAPWMAIQRVTVIDDTRESRTVEDGARGVSAGRATPARADRRTAKKSERFSLRRCSYDKSMEDILRVTDMIGMTFSPSFRSEIAMHTKRSVRKTRRLCSKALPGRIGQARMCIKSGTLYSKAANSHIQRISRVGSGRSGAASREICRSLCALCGPLIERLPLSQDWCASCRLWFCPLACTAHRHPVRGFAPCDSDSDCGFVYSMEMMLRVTNKQLCIPKNCWVTSLCAWADRLPGVVKQSHIE